MARRFRKTGFFDVQNCGWHFKEDHTVFMYLPKTTVEAGGDRVSSKATSGISNSSHNGRNLTCLHYYEPLAILVPRALLISTLSLKSRHGR